MRLLSVTALLALALFAASIDRPETSRAAFPGENGLIAFVERFEEVGIYTINPDGTGLATIPNTQGADDVSWSPEGQRLAFTRSGIIRSINADGTGVITMIEGSNPTWSANGLAIGFDRDDDLFFGLIDGSDGIGLTDTPIAQEFQLVLAPDETKIAYSNNPDPGDVDSDRTIWVMGRNGDNPHSLGPTAGGFARGPDWSPDSSRITYYDDGGDIWVMDADGSNQVMLSGDATFDHSPVFSPDGTKIAFVRQVPIAASSVHPLGDTANNIWIMDADDGGNQVNLTNVTDKSYNSPSWQPVLTPRVWGDLDCNGEVNSRDNQALLREVLSQLPLSQTEPCSGIDDPLSVAGNGQNLFGDLDCSGEISSRDNQALLRIVLSQTPLSQELRCPPIEDEVLIGAVP